jgi:hypothetical protein
MTPSRREGLLIAIAKARKWIDDLAHGRAASFGVMLAAKARSNGRCGGWLRSLSYRPALCQPSSTALRRPISR